MAILDSLRKEQWGVWKTNDELFAALRLRDTAALTALGAVLGMDAALQKELASGEGADVLSGVVADLRQQKGVRVAAARCCIEAGLPAEKMAALFLCAADLVTDPRLGAKAKVLAESGLSAAIDKRPDLRDVGQPAGDFARGAHAAASVLGAARVKELLAAAPLGHAGASAARFALGEELPPGQKESWEKVLVEQCTANRKAPAAAKRMGLAKPWPPFLPEAFAPLIKVAEEKTANVATTDALARAPAAKPAPVAVAPGPVPSGKPAPGAGASAVGPPLTAKEAQAAARERLANIGQQTHASAAHMNALAQESTAQRKSNSEYLGTRKLEPAIQRQRSRQDPLVRDAPEVRETRRMPEVVGQPAEGLMPDMSPAALAARAAKAGVSIETLAETERLAGRLPASVLAALAAERGILLPDGRFYKGDEPLRFDPDGKRIPRPDRWEEYEFEWQDPVLPPSQLRKPIKASVLQGPFAARLKSIFEDRPEGVERLCAAAEARAAIVGEEQLFTELTVEMAKSQWQRMKISAGQRTRLRAVADDSARPSSWRRSAEALLAMDARPRSAEEQS